jgi:branched-chain amino acid transport system substrate-binding protein
MQTMQDMYIAETFYWDQDDRTRAFTRRLQQQQRVTAFPNYVHAGNYSGVTHYLKAVRELGVARAKASGREVVALMKRLPTDDDAYGRGSIREDGRKIHPSHLYQVKRPQESRGPGDVYKLAVTIPADQAFRPLSEGGCALIRS